MATTKKAAKTAAKPKVDKPKAAKPAVAPKPKVEAIAPVKDAPEVEAAKPKHEPKPAHAKPELGPIDGVLVNVMLVGDEYVVTNITDKHVTVRETASKGYYATALQSMGIEPGETFSFVRRDGVRLEPSFTP